MKIIETLTILCVLSIAILLTAFSCGSDIYSYEKGCQYEYGKLIGHPNIYLINQSGKSVYLEWNPRYPMDRADSLFSGFQVQVKDSLNLMPLKSKCWEGELMHIPFVRIFLFDAPYNSISNHPDSLRAFQNEHLVYQHWYTKKELDSLGWKIYYPPLEIE